jgi:hypothetical protein
MIIPKLFIHLYHQIKTKDEQITFTSSSFNSLRSGEVDD